MLVKVPFTLMVELVATEQSDVVHFVTAILTFTFPPGERSAAMGRIIEILAGTQFIEPELLTMLNRPILTINPGVKRVFAPQEPAELGATEIALNEGDAFI
jgi:hypothetical protein